MKLYLPKAGLLLCRCALLSLAAGRPEVRAQEAFLASPQFRTDFWEPDGRVDAVLVTNGVVYLGGSFNYLAPSGRKVVAYDADTGAPDPLFPVIRGAGINALIADGVGGWYLGGTFHEVGGWARTNLVHVLNTGDVDPDFHPDPDGAVRTLALGEDTLLVGGGFNTINGVVRRGLAALDLTNHLASRWTFDGNGGVSNVVAAGSTVYVGGFFTQMGGQARTNLAALDAETGAALPWRTWLDGTVTSLALAEDRLVVGGFFNSIGGQLRSGLAALDLGTAETLTNWNPNPVGGKVLTVRVACDTVYVGGYFTQLDDSVRFRVGAVDVHSGRVTPWDPGLQLLSGSTLPSSVRALEVSGDRVFIGGEFSSVRGEVRRDLVAVDSIFGQVQSWNPDPNGGVTALAAAGRTVLVGFLTAAGGVERRNLAALDARTGRPLAWNPDVDGEVQALAFWNNRLFLGGGFTAVDGFLRPHLAALDAFTGQVVTDWNPGASSNVLALAVAGDSLYAGGQFVSLGGAARLRLAALDPSTGQVFPAWIHNANGTVDALLPVGDTLHVAGNFITIDGQTRHRLAGIGLSSGALTGWNPDANRRVHALASLGGALFVGGEFDTLGGQARTNLAAVDALTGQALPWGVDANQPVYALAASGEAVYVGGTFTRLGDASRRGIAALSPAGELLDWDPGRSDGNAVLVLTAVDGQLYVGGDPDLEFESSSARHSLGVFPRMGAPAILAAPLDQTVLAGADVVLSVTATGEAPFAYVWQFEGVFISGASNSTLTLPNVVPANSGAYVVSILNPRGVITAEVHLNVLQPVAFVTQPAGVTLGAGGAVNLTAVVTGAPAPLFQWRLNGINIPGAVSSSLSRSNAQPTNGGSYQLVAFNGAGAILSAVATVVVNGNNLPFADQFSNRGLLVGAEGVGGGSNVGATRELGEPNHFEKLGGHSIWLRWVATDDGIATFSTRGSTFDTLLAIYSGTTLSGLQPEAADDERGGFHTSQVSFNARAGTEYAIAVDGFAGESGHVVVAWRLEAVSPVLPRILTQPESRSVSFGDTATFSVAVASNAVPPGFQWFFGCSPVRDATNATLTVTNIRRRHVGSYRVFVLHASGAVSESSEASLEIGPASRVVSRDKLEELLPELIEGGGTGGLAAASLSSGFIAVSLGSIESQLINTTNATRQPGEPLLCGGVGGASKWLRVRPELDATFVFDTLGSALDTVLAVFTSDNLLRPYSTLVACDDNGASSGGCSLVRFDARAGHDYFVVVDDVRGRGGAIRLNWKLGRAPLISPPPTNRPTVLLGGSATLQVRFTNDFGASIQWWYEGQLMVGATNTTLAVSNASLAQAGVYRAIVSNFAGTATNALTLLVAQPALQLEPRLWEGVIRVWLPALTNETVILESSSDLRVWVPRSYQVPAGVASSLDFSVTDFKSRFFRFPASNFGAAR